MNRKEKKAENHSIPAGHFHFVRLFCGNCRLPVRSEGRLKSLSKKKPKEKELKRFVIGKFASIFVPFKHSLRHFSLFFFDFFALFASTAALNETEVIFPTHQLQNSLISFCVQVFLTIFLENFPPKHNSHRKQVTKSHTSPAVLLIGITKTRHKQHLGWCRQLKLKFINCF